MPNGWGVHFWMISPRTLFVRFTRRRGRRFTAAVISRDVTPGRWQFVGASYNGRTGQAKLFVNRRFTARKYIGRIRLATNYPVRMGARIGDGRYFRGRISCMQVYNGALSLRQILSKKRLCFRRGKHVGAFKDIPHYWASNLESRRAKQALIDLVVRSLVISTVFSKQG